MGQVSGSPIGLLLSGGLDSCVLLAQLLEKGHRVQPFYVRCGLVWEACEIASTRRFLAAVAGQYAPEVVLFDMPLSDLYGEHWSINGRNTPDAHSPDEAVFLPGRNALLVIKPAIWCQLHGIETLALAVLSGNPFADATDEFFRAFQTVVDQASRRILKIQRPLAGMTKQQVMQLGRRYPLELTFSCINPIEGWHCGRCNKCAERRSAFQSVGLSDATRYANLPPAHHCMRSNAEGI
jgi:7-cyano-7-deazaguanine synthase